MAAVEHEMAHKRHYTEAEKAQATASEMEKRLVSSLPMRQVAMSQGLITFATSVNAEMSKMMDYCYQWMEKAMPEVDRGRFREAAREVVAMHEKLPGGVRAELKKTFSNSVEILSGESQWVS